MTEISTFKELLEDHLANDAFACENADTKSMLAKTKVEERVVFLEHQWLVNNCLIACLLRKLASDESDQMRARSDV